MANRELVVLGTASQTPTRERNQNGYLLRWDGAGLLFDPGEGTQRQLLLAGVKASEISCLCITHFHGDHCLGVPGVLQRISLDQLGRPILACYPAENMEIFSRLRNAALFHDTVQVRERPVESGVIVTGPPFRLEARPLSHTVPAVGYRLTEPDSVRMLPGLLARHGVAGPDVGRLLRDGSLQLAGRRVSLAEVSEPRPGQVFAFIMDTRLCDTAFELAERADLLVCESTFLQADAALAHYYGHLTAGQAARIAAESGARRLVLTHFSQRYSHQDGRLFAGEAAAVFDGDVVVASDLMTIPVPARAEA